MKNFKLIKRLALSIFIISILSSCQPKPAELLLGTWKLTNYESSAQKDEDEQAIFDEIKAENISNQSYVFETDKLILKTGSDEKPASWLISKDEKSLKIQLPGNDAFYFSIVELSETKLKLSQQTEDGTIITSSFSKEK